jgi:hypothetical protein
VPRPCAVPAQLMKGRGPPLVKPVACCRTGPASLRPGQAKAEGQRLSVFLHACYTSTLPCLLPSTVIEVSRCCPPLLVRQISTLVQALMERVLKHLEKGREL